MNSTLTLSTKCSTNGKTQLDEYFATPPFKVMAVPAYQDAWQNGLNTMQMSSSPGLLGGDKLDIRLTLAKNTSLSLGTQAFTRVQAMNEGEFAEQQTQIELAEGSRLFYLHRDAAFKQVTEVQLRADCVLIYGEIVAIGRVANNERFAFRAFSSHLTVQLLQNDGRIRPLVRDCIQWHPANMPLTALSQMEDFSHQGSLIYLNLTQNTQEIKQCVHRLQTQLAEDETLLAGISQLHEGGLIVRVLGHRADTIEQLFKQIGEQLKAN